MLRRVLLVPVLVVGGALAGCSSGADAPDALGTPVAGSANADAGAVESCDLLSVADIERITGTVLPEGESPTEREDGP